jgi:DNA repair exonuclease SbcCD nuclease subunit
MRLLLFSDLHLDAPFTWAGPELARIRRRALRTCLLRIVDLAGQLGVDAVCCAGDLYEQERVTPDTAAFLRDAFARLHPVPVFLAPGNHDWLGPTSIYRVVDWTDNVEILTGPRLAPVPLADGLTLWGAAHASPANTPGFLDGFRVDRGGVHIALLHGSEQGELSFEDDGKRPHAPFRASQIPEAGLHHALVGHFHTPRDASFHTYAGNPEPLTFGETGERGAVLVTVDGAGGVTRERHRVAVSRVSDVTVPLDGVRHAAEVRERVAAAVAGLTGSVRVRLEGEIAPEVDLDPRELDPRALAGLAPHLDALVPVLGRITVGYDLDALALERTVRGQFVRDVREADDLTEDQRRRVLITGLRALDGRRTDLEVH